ncbi:MAG: DUF3833 domain-containing protein [Burkholderiales bacterium]|nr:DUF3833 domain-containing protein [Burkholderiales bacterium]MDP2397234.1 DUF3833 domain-containing protein [Burkholderiales bacterium]MDP3715595.1 DUF3833 domain-containing protein [Burkholderiales bacterium]
MKGMRWMLAALLLALAGCGSVPVERYRDERPAMDLQRYFDGTIDAWGMFQDRSGKVVKRFYVRIDASWSGDTGVLDEHFEYSDGTRSRRVWTITRIGANRYRGTADDVIGEAYGEVQGNALRWQYVLALEVDGRTWEVDFDDWMYMIDDQVMLNRSVMSKFGIRLGEVILSFRKRT